MEFSKSVYINVHLTKHIIVDLTENYLMKTAFKNLKFVSGIDISSKEQSLDMGNLTFQEFKNEVLSSTKFDRFSMCIMYERKEYKYTFILLKSSEMKEEISIALKSHNKIWVDDNIAMVEKFFINYGDEKHLKGKEPINIDEYAATKEEFVEEVKKANDFISYEAKKKKRLWQKADIIGIISIIVAISIAVFQCLMQKK